VGPVVGLPRRVAVEGLGRGREVVERDERRVVVDAVHGRTPPRDVQALRVRLNGVVAGVNGEGHCNCCGLIEPRRRDETRSRAVRARSIYWNTWIDEQDRVVASCRRVVQGLYEREKPSCQIGVGGGRECFLTDVLGKDRSAQQLQACSESDTKVDEFPPSMDKWAGLLAGLTLSSEIYFLKAKIYHYLCFFPKKYTPDGRRLGGRIFMGECMQILLRKGGSGGKPHPCQGDRGRAPVPPPH
jgi:hypothetical protein